MVWSMTRAVGPAYWQNYAALWVPLPTMGTKLEKDKGDLKSIPVICLKSIFYKNIFFLKKIGPQEMGQPVDAALRCADFLSFLCASRYR
jgi:hypothetical protein